MSAVQDVDASDKDVDASMHDAPPADPADVVMDNPVDLVDLSKIEGVREGISRIEVIRHARAFYSVILPMMEKMNEAKAVMPKAKYVAIIAALKRLRAGETITVLKRAGYRNIFHWKKNYAIINAGDNKESTILVLRPKTLQENIAVGEIHRFTYLEKLFADMLEHHGDDHAKGRSFHSRLRDVYCNISRHVAKMFTDTCPGCIMEQQRMAPLAGLRPIITAGFGTRGQVDLIDFQSMPDHGFNFLLNYIDHGIKALFYVPIVRKRASCVAYALFQVCR